jgi:hypothetical protein
LKLREGFHRTVENNIMINNTFHPHVWLPGNGDVFVKNIVSAAYAPIRINDWGREIDYNVFPDEIALKKAQENGTDKHSVAGDPEFTDPQKGDFRVREGSVAFTVGFENFDTDHFGVVSPELKASAKPVPLPGLTRPEGIDEELRETVLGMNVKNVTTLGERSAAGLGDESGVWIVEVLPESPAKGILRANDVILRINSEKVNNIRELKEALMKGHHAVGITFSRNQKEESRSVGIR